MIWLVGASWPWFLAFAVVLGTGYGGWIALQPTVLAELFGVRGLGGLVGLSYMGGGIGALVGPPLAGLLVDATGGYRWAIAAAGLLGSARSWRSSRYSRGQRSADLRRAAGPTALDRTTAMAQAAGSSGWWNGWPETSTRSSPISSTMRC